MHIRIIGPVAPTGYGVVTRQLTLALAKLGARVSLLPIGPTSMERMSSGERLVIPTAIANRQPGQPDMDLVVWHEWDHPPVHLPADTAYSKRYVALPIFELDRLREGAFEALSKCWRVLAGTRHAEKVLNNAHLDNVHYLPFMGVDNETFKPIPRLRTDRFTILNVGKQEYRKGHDLVIMLAARMLAFNARNFEFWCMWDNPFLPNNILVAQRDKWIMDAASAMRVDIGDIHDRIRMVSPVDTPEDMCQLINRCDVTLYPYRAEGWNLPLLEAMACGKQSIATYTSGPVDYMNKENALTIDVLDSEPAFDGVWFKGQGNWAVPSLHQAFIHLARLYVQWGSSIEDMPANKAGVQTAKEFSWSATAHRLLDWITTACGAS